MRDNRIVVGTVKVPVSGKSRSGPPRRGTIFLKGVLGGWQPDGRGEWPGEKVGALARALCEAMPPRTKVGIQLRADSRITICLTINGEGAALSFDRGNMAVTLPKKMGQEVVDGFSRFFGRRPFLRLTPPEKTSLFFYMWTRNNASIEPTIAAYRQVVTDLERL